MRTEQRTKNIEYTVYIADDGVEYENEKDCKFHDRLVHDEIKTCDKCKGTGKISEEQWDENYHTGVPEKFTVYNTCPCCKGKGYLEKKIVWV